MGRGADGSSRPLASTAATSVVVRRPNGTELTGQSIELRRAKREKRRGGSTKAIGECLPPTFA
jgi:hypothetical protein